ncbi:MAG: hypothetical protein HY225_03700 [Candidatus Vogelbacteria bacterium]|nr:hypothetical protein [Candidatus Vogelbacteria bacterium]
MSVNTNFNVTHPEKRVGEIFYMNLTSKEFMDLKLKTKRLGNIPYDNLGRVGDGRLQVRPVFVKRGELKDLKKIRISTSQKTRSQKKGKTKQKVVSVINTASTISEVFVPYNKKGDESRYTNCAQPNNRVGFLDLESAKKYAARFGNIEVLTIKILNWEEFSKEHLEYVRQNALRKLTGEEKKALGLYNR